jgi:hypothetical protein
LAEDRSIKASLWFRMYCSSGAGKAGDRGTAMDFVARIASSVTLREKRQFTMDLRKWTGGAPRGCSWLTHIVVAILDQESHALAIDVVPPSGLIQAVPDLAHVAEQLPVPEPAAAAGVDNGGRVRVMARDCLEHGQSW